MACGEDGEGEGDGEGREDLLSPYTLHPCTLFLRQKLRCKDATQETEEMAFPGDAGLTGEYSPDETSVQYSNKDREEYGSEFALEVAA
jgi:hypothetical protein